MSDTVVDATLSRGHDVSSVVNSEDLSIVTGGQSTAAVLHAIDAYRIAEKNGKMRLENHYQGHREFACSRNDINAEPSCGPCDFKTAIVIDVYHLLYL